MPKFMTYQRPAPVTKANWGTPVRRPQPARLPTAPKPVLPPAPAATLDQLFHKSRS